MPSLIMKHITPQLTSMLLSLVLFVLVQNKLHSKILGLDSWIDHQNLRIFGAI